MSRTMNILVAFSGAALGVALTALPAPASTLSQWHCENPRDLVADALQGECGAQAQGGAAPQDQKKPSQKWWRGEENRKEFGITEQQSRDIEAVFQQTLPTLKVNKTDLDREEKALSLLLGATTSSESAVLTAIERVETTRSTLSRTYTLMQFRMYRLLSPEARTKVQAYHEHRAQDGGHSTRR